jgi:DNA polymerase I-like protein with 3'-5' exonuclease and polymerase domains
LSDRGAVSLPPFIASPDPTRYLGDNWLVLDFETEVNDERFGSSLDSRNALALACWCDSAGRVDGHWGNEFDQKRLIERIGLVDFLVCHNTKYELGWLSRCGVDTSKLLCFDTKIAEYVLLGNLAAGDSDNGVRRVSTSLDDCSIRRGNKPKDPIVDLWMTHGIKVSQMPMRWVSQRCVQDVQSTHALFLDQRKALASTNRLGCLYTRCILTPVLAAIEQEKIHLDPSRVHSTFDEFTERLGTLEREFIEVTGGINWRSPKQVAQYIYGSLGFSELTGRDGKPKRTTGGLRLTDAKTLPRLRVTSDAQRSFLNLKKALGSVGFALSKNLNYFKEICDTESFNCLFTAEFNQTVTATHRLSCSGIPTPAGNSVQLQNIPRSFKRLFSARRPGWLIGEADGAQLEFRVAAYLGNDRQAKIDISDPNWDAHCVTAAAMIGKTYEEVYSAYKAGEKWAADARQAAKPETFKPLYGGSKGTKAQERWYAEFKRRYPDLAKVQEDWVYEVLQTKKLVTPWGLRYYFPTAKLSPTGYCNVGSSVYNYPVQALATAEIIPIAVTYFWHTVRAEALDRYIIPVNTVHDSLVCEIHPEYVDDFKRISALAFGPAVWDYLMRVYKLDFDVPLGCGVKVGTHWGEGKEEKFEYVKER